MRKNIKINEHKPLVNIFCLMLMSQLPSQGNSRTQGRRVIPRPFPQLHIHTHTYFFMHELFSSLLLPTVNSVRTHLYLMFFLYCLLYKRARMWMTAWTDKKHCEVVRWTTYPSLSLLLLPSLRPFFLIRLIFFKENYEQELILPNYPFKYL